MRYSPFENWSWDSKDYTAVCDSTGEPCVIQVWLQKCLFVLPESMQIAMPTNNNWEPRVIKDNGSFTRCHCWSGVFSIQIPVAHLTKHLDRTRKKTGIQEKKPKVVFSLWKNKQTKYLMDIFLAHTVTVLFIIRYLFISKKIIVKARKAWMHSLKCLTKEVEKRKPPWSNSFISFTW